MRVIATEPRRNTGNGERAEVAQEIDDAFGVLCLIARINALQFLSDLLNHVRCQQITLAGLAEQFTQQVTVERQQRCASFSLWGITGVDKFCNIAKQQWGGERRGLFGRHLNQLYISLCQLFHQLVQGRQIVDILQAFACGFDQDGEIIILSGDVQQLTGAQPLLPEW